MKRYRKTRRNIKHTGGKEAVENLNQIVDIRFGRPLTEQELLQQRRQEERRRQEEIRRQEEQPSMMDLLNNYAVFPSVSHDGGLRRKKKTRIRSRRSRK